MISPISLFLPTLSLMTEVLFVKLILTNIEFYFGFSFECILLLIYNYQICSLLTISLKTMHYTVEWHGVGSGWDVSIVKYNVISSLVKALFIFIFFISETKKNILIEEKIQEKEEIQQKEKKTREGWEVLPTKNWTKEKTPNFRKLKTKKNPNILKLLKCKPQSSWVVKHFKELL